MTCSPYDQDDSLRHLLEQALLLPRRHDLLQQQETVRQILNSVPTRRWLYEAACQTSNRNRSIRVRSLIVEIMQYSGNLWREPTVSADDYEEALARTWEWFGRNLCKYDPERASFMTWFNNRLSWTIQTVIRERTIEEKKRYRFSPMPDGEESWSIDDIPDLPDFITESQLFLEQVLELVQRDPDRQLGNCRMQGHPTITCQAIILSILQSRFTSAKIPWNELAQMFRIEQNQLRNFCRNTAFPCFRSFCRRHNLMNL